MRWPAWQRSALGLSEITALHTSIFYDIVPSLDIAAVSVAKHKRGQHSRSFAVSARNTSHP